MRTHLQQYALLLILAILPLNQATAESLMARLLKFTGITITSSKLRGTGFEGNLWLININGEDSNDARKITTDGSYRTPLWIQGSHNILAVKQGMLVQLNVDNNIEKTLYSLPESHLHGFDKTDANAILITQKSQPAVLSLDSGKITPIPYDPDNPSDLKVLKSLNNNFRVYGKTTVYLKKEKRVIPGAGIKDLNKIHINSPERNLIIACPAECAQPSLNVSSQLLVFVGL